MSGKTAFLQLVASVKKKIHLKLDVCRTENPFNVTRSAIPKSAAAKYISPAIPIITNISSFPQQKTPDFHPGFFITCKIRLESFSI